LSPTLAIALALAAGPLVLAAPAQAAATPTPLSFDHLVLDTQVTGEAEIVSDGTAPLTVTADIDPTTGDFTVDPASFSAPTDTTSEGSLSLALAGQASGNLNFTTGAVTLNGDFLATINAPSLGGSCTIDTGPLTLSTATTVPLAGMAFGAGPTSLQSGDGALGAGWSSLAPGTGPACPTIDSFIDSSAGGIWVSRGISPTGVTSSGPDAGPAAAEIALKTRQPATVAAGATAKIKVTVTNRGGADSQTVTVCLAAKAPLSPLKACQTVRDPGAKSTHTLVFRVKSTRATQVGKHLLTLTASGQRSQTLTLKVAR
jgi:hypothetical protein